MLVLWAYAVGYAIYRVYASVARTTSQHDPSSSPHNIPPFDLPHTVITCACLASLLCSRYLAVCERLTWRGVVVGVGRFNSRWTRRLV